ncbi:MAG TPA: NADPH-dependent FMN reductase [Chryseosolibacter sp.]|nr:NADPH-dependent FMN reductase [Chryseosolibacter sp.]
MDKKHILIIIGSASRNSANEKLMQLFASLTKDEMTVTMINDLKVLPHFNPELSGDSPPPVIANIRNQIGEADGIIICTPEYVFSIPSGLKNLIEWCVSTTVFMNKPTGLITASANGQKAHEELQLIMRTVMCDFNEQTTLLIQGIKGKINDQLQITDKTTETEFENFINGFKQLLQLR